ncbi:MAG TPA: glycosyltransferase family 1 protein [Vicinamibacterales bacterium]|nr:glycosyltransferase family 1 protein [Vicinamibacterales bacterium]
MTRVSSFRGPDVPVVPTAAAEKRVLRVAIEAQITQGVQGGLEQYLMALTAGLRDEAGSAWAYTVVASNDDRDWLRPFLGPDHDIVTRPTGPASAGEELKRWLGPVRAPAGRLWRQTLRLAGQQAKEQVQRGIVASDGFIERLDADVVHFPYVAHYEHSSVPAVLTMHDLQHRHFPQFFSKSHLAWREEAYPAAMAHAAVVIADSEFVRDDIIRQYGVPAEKIVSIPLASSLRFHPPPTREFVEALRVRWALPEAFALYPAMTNEHKNHIRLLEAVARLRDNGRPVPLVCSGKQAHVWPAIQRRLGELRLEELVRFTGFIAPQELLALYQLAQFVVFPSVFEGAGLPVLEAMEQGVPVTCSEIPTLREYAAESALFFDPSRVDAIEHALERMSGDPALRTELREAARRRAPLFTPQEMARRHHAVYRRASEMETWPRNASH